MARQCGLINIGEKPNKKLKEAEMYNYVAEIGFKLGRVPNFLFGLFL
jgi:hypothetical protein